jgi:hypothetical protein
MSALTTMHASGTRRTFQALQTSSSGFTAVVPPLDASIHSKMFPHIWEGKLGADIAV